jgi:hypothetical protein
MVTEGSTPRDQRHDTFVVLPHNNRLHCQSQASHIVFSLTRVHPVFAFFDPNLITARGVSAGCADLVRHAQGRL